MRDSRSNIAHARMNSRHTTDVNFPTVAIYDDPLVKPFGRAYGTEFGNGEIITTTVSTRIIDRGGDRRRGKISSIQIVHLF